MTPPLGQLKLRIDLNYADSSRKTIFKTTVRRKISDYGKVAKEEIIIDLIKMRKFHHIEELDEKGNWVVVPHPDEPLKKLART